MQFLSRYIYCPSPMLKFLFKEIHSCVCDSSRYDVLHGSQSFLSLSSFISMSKLFKSFRSELF